MWFFMCNGQRYFGSNKTRDKMRHDAEIRSMESDEACCKKVLGREYVEKILSEASFGSYFSVFSDLQRKALLWNSKVYVNERKRLSNMEKFIAAELAK